MRQVVPGNIDLNNRPILRNADGSISTVRSMSFGSDQGEVLIPTVGPDGEDLSEEEAIALYEKTGQHLGIFSTPDEATSYAEQLHVDQERRYMNPFNTPPQNLLAAIPAPAEERSQTSPEVARRTGQLAALANLGASEEAASIFAAADEQAAMYEERARNFGEMSVREEIAAARHQERLGALEGVLRDNLPTGDRELVEGAAIAYNNLVELDAREDAQYALEQQAVERIQALAAGGDVTQARVMLSNLENGNALDVIRDYQAKQQILESAIQRAEFEVRDQSWLRGLADFALSVIPLYSPSRTGNVDVADSVKNWYDSLFAGERFRNEADALWDMSPKELAEFVNGDFLRNLHENATFLGYTNNTERLELLTGLAERTPSAWETNAWSAVDIGGFVPWGKAARLGGGLTSMMVRTGARREAAELTARAALDVLQDSTEATARSGMSVDQVARNLEVSAVAPEGTASRVPIANQAIAGMERGRELLKSLGELERTFRLSREEFDKAVQAVRSHVERKFGRETKDVDVEDVTLADGTSVNRVVFTLGKKDGDGFASEAMANRYLGSIGEAGEAIQDESGQWFARVSIDVPETGFYTNLLNVRTPGPWRFVLNARNVGDQLLADAAQVAGNKRNKMLRILVKPYEHTFRALNPREKEALSQVLQAGETHGAWFNKDQLESLYRRRWNRAPTSRELNGYQAARDINDIEFALRNDDVYKQRVLRGYQTASFDTGMGRVDRVNAIVDRELKEPPRTRFYDVSAGRHYTDGISARQWARMRSQGYIVVTLEVPLKMADGTTIKTFAVKGKDTLLENLRRDQIAYRAGGHRMYKGKYFVKQTVRGFQPDTGKEFLENPATYIVARTKAEAQYWAKRMEAARLAYLDEADLSVIDEIFGGEAGFPSAEDFVRGMKDGTFQKDTPFGVYFDREMPKEYVLNGQGMEFVDPDDTGFNGLLRAHGRMYTGRKGAHLPDYMGEKAPLLDPFETINRSLMNISALTSFGDYKIQSVERWMRTFGEYLDIKPGDPLESASDIRKFMEAPFVKGGNDELARIRNAGLAQRQIIKRTLGWKTDNDLRAEQWARHLNEWVQGGEVNGLLPNARRDLSNWVSDKNPISALRSFAFDLKLGLFNIAQLPLQLSTAVAAVALSPKRGMQGWAMIAPMRFLLGGRVLSREAFESRLDELIKRGVPDLGGFSNGNEFKQFARAALRSGFFDLGGTHVLVDHYGPHAALDGFQSGVQRVREAGRFFFFEAERWNRLVAWRIAWDEAKESGLKIGSPEFAAKLHGRAEEYSFNMSRESQAWWQKGVLSIPTQFWAYNARMLEAMTVGNFTPAQKMRLVIAQSLLYGSAGLPITGFVSEMIKAKNGDAPDIETFWGTADRGVIDRLVFEMTGADVLVGERYGTGNWSAELIRNIFGMSQYGEVSTADVLGGATYSILGKVGTDLIRPVVEYMAAESGDEGIALRRDSLIRLASNISMLGNYFKYELVRNYGQYRSANGTTLADDLPSQDAFAVLLGIQPAEMDEISAMNSFLKDKSKAVNEAAKVITNYRVDMMNRPDQRESIMAEVNAFVRLLPPDVRADALRRANQQVDPSLYASLADRIERERLQDGATD